MNVSKRLISLLLALVLIVSSMSISVFAKGDIAYGIGFVTGNGLRLRSSDSTRSRILDSASKKEVVLVLDKVGDWYKVIYNLQVGYMHGDYVSVATKENAELGYGVINGNHVNLRSGPSTSHKALAQGNKGDKAYIIGLNEGWYKVIFGDRICYIRSDYMDLAEIPYENKDSSNSPKFFRGGKSTGTAPSASALGNKVPDVSVPEVNVPETNNKPDAVKPETNKPNTVKPDTNKPETIKPELNGSLGTQIVETAKKYLGVRYVYGGASPSGFDCSGLVYYVLKSVGISAYRTPADQYKMGTYVEKSDLQPGDIVFFQNTYKSGISHVGIYVGDGKFIHAPNSRSVVSYADLNSTYYTQHYYGARRMG